MLKKKTIQWVKNEEKSVGKYKKHNKYWETCQQGLLFSNDKAIHGP